MARSSETFCGLEVAALLLSDVCLEKGIANGASALSRSAHGRGYTGSGLARHVFLPPSIDLLARVFGERRGDVPNFPRHPLDHTAVLVPTFINECETPAS